MANYTQQCVSCKGTMEYSIHNDICGECSKKPRPHITHGPEIFGPGYITWGCDCSEKRMHRHRGAVVEIKCEMVSCWAVGKRFPETPNIRLCSKHRAKAEEVILCDKCGIELNTDFCRSIKRCRICADRLGYPGEEPLTDFQRRIKFMLEEEIKRGN